MPRTRPSPAQKASSAERLLSAHLILSSDGAIDLSDAQPDNYGADFLLTYAGFSPDLKLQVASSVREPARNRVEFRFDLNEVPAADPTWFAACVELTAKRPYLGDAAWLIPAKALLADRPAGRRRYKVSMSLDPVVPSKWNRYLVATDQLAPALRARFAAADLAIGKPARRAKHPHQHTTTDAIGFAVEALVCAHLWIHGNSQFETYRPTPDRGIDRMVRDDRGGPAMRVQIKGAARRSSDGWVQVRIRARTFKQSRLNFLAIFVFDPATIALGPWFWLIRTDELAKLAYKEDDDLIFEASPDPANTRDKYAAHRYRLKDLPTATRALLDRLRREGPAARLPSARADLLGAPPRSFGPRGKEKRLERARPGN
jgi:hypothetical protein